MAGRTSSRYPEADHRNEGPVLPLITGPGWKGHAPEGSHGKLKSPTGMVWILGRTYFTGTPEDYKAAHADYGSGTSWSPLSSYGKPYTPPKGKVDPTIDARTPVREQVQQALLGRRLLQAPLAKLMKDNPPRPKENAPILEKMAKIGIVPGQDFDVAELDPAVAKRFESPSPASCCISSSATATSRTSMAGASQRRPASTVRTTSSVRS